MFMTGSEGIDLRVCATAGYMEVAEGFSQSFVCCLMVSVVLCAWHPMTLVMLVLHVLIMLLYCFANNQVAAKCYEPCEHCFVVQQKICEAGSKLIPLFQANQKATTFDRLTIPPSMGAWRAELLLQVLHPAYKSSICGALQL